MKKIRIENKETPTKINKKPQENEKKLIKKIPNKRNCVKIIKTHNFKEKLFRNINSKKEEFIKLIERDDGTIIFILDP
jgi:hypothetical protein